MITVAGQSFLPPFTPLLWDPLLSPDGGPAYPPACPGPEQDLRPNTRARFHLLWVTKKKAEI